MTTRDVVLSAQAVPEGWSILPLGELTSWMSGGTPSKSNAGYWGGDIPWISAKSLKSFYLYDSEDHVTDAAIADGARQADTGDILILVRGMTLHNDVPVGIAMRPMTFNQDVKGLRGKGGAATRYIAYWLVGNKGRLLAAVDQASHGTGRLRTDVLQEMNVLLPPPDEQDSIAAILGALDNKIEQNRRTARALERLARTIFRAWFMDFEPVKAKAEGATSFPSMPQQVFDALPIRFVDSEIGPVPEGWEVKAIGDVCDVNARMLRAGEFSGEIEYINISSVSHGHLHEVERMDFSDAPSRARRLIQDGDTIWSCVRPNRMSYLYIHNPPENRIVSTGFAVLSPKRIGPSFLYQLTTQPEFVDYLVANATGSAYPAVRGDLFENARFCCAPSGLLDIFEELSQPMRQCIGIAEGESRKLAKMRDYLLPRILSGSVRVETING